MKEDKFYIIRELLLETPNFLLDFDYFSRTALHWVCEMGFFELLDLFLEYPAFLRLNMKDCEGKTALFLACIGGFIEIVRKLLYFGASPWSDVEIKYKEDLMGKEIYQEIRKARKIEIMMKFAKGLKEKARIWKDAKSVFL